MTNQPYFQWFGRVYRPMPASPTRLQLLKRAELFARDSCNGAFTNGTQRQSMECVKAHTIIVDELEAELTNQKLSLSAPLRRDVPQKGHIWSRARSGGSWVKEETCAFDQASRILRRYDTQSPYRTHCWSENYPRG